MLEETINEFFPHTLFNADLLISYSIIDNIWYLTLICISFHFE